VAAETVRWRAPGRVNLIGEHTDYNGGLALPFAIDRTCLAVVSPMAGGYRATSERTGTVTVPSLDEVAAADPWARYVLGAAAVLARRGVEVPPVAVHVDSDVPSGAGLSSSAALICSVVAALDDVLGLGLDADEQVQLAVAVENDVVGAPTGGLDQLVAVHARAGHALLCGFADPASPTVEHVPLDLEGHGLSVLVVDTGVRHSHADGEYAARRHACERAAALLGVGWLGQLGPADLDSAVSRLEYEELRRCVRHVVTEDQRVRDVVALLREGRVEEIGRSLSDSHRSLRDDYRVSCAELDLAVGAMESAGAVGARMTGGGFGGCAIGLVPTGQVEQVAAAVVTAYQGAGLAAPRWFTARPSAGTRPDPDQDPPPGPPSG
jgi:galactokinase